MKLVSSRSLLTAVLLVALQILPACTKSAHESAREKIAATIFPIADMVKHIAGDQIEIVTLLPSGANPHTFEPAPEQVRNLVGTKIVFVIGGDFDRWLSGLSESFGRTSIIDMSDGVDRSGVSQPDPHYWLSIRNAKVMVNHITDVLTQAWPEHKNIFETNRNIYLKQLNEADRLIQTRLSTVSARKMITFHDGWRYFARDYKLEIIGTVEPPSGGEPTSKRLTELSALIRLNQIKVLFSEPFIPASELEAIANDFGLHIFELNPLGVEGQDSYINLMLKNADIVAKALNHE